MFLWKTLTDTLPMALSAALEISKGKGILALFANLYWSDNSYLGHL